MLPGHNNWLHAGSCRGHPARTLPSCYIVEWFPPRSLCWHRNLQVNRYIAYFAAHAGASNSFQLPLQRARSSPKDRLSTWLFPRHRASPQILLSLGNQIRSAEGVVLLRLSAEGNPSRSGLSATQFASSAESIRLSAHTVPRHSIGIIIQAHALPVLAGVTYICLPAALSQSSTTTREVFYVLWYSVVQFHGGASASTVQLRSSAPGNEQRSMGSMACDPLWFCTDCHHAAVHVVDCRRGSQGSQKAWLRDAGG